MSRRFCYGFALLVLLACASSLAAAEKMKALIIEGQNNHGNWPQTTQMMKKYLEETDLFAVDIARTKPNGEDPNFKPEFAKYQLVLSNYNGAPWPKETQETFVEFVKNGGGFVVVHAADNSFGDWKEYNEMIGLGGWGGRNEKRGPYVYFNDEGEAGPRRKEAAAAATARSIRFRSSFATPSTRSPRACRRRGCTRTTNFTTGSAARRRT